MAAPGASARWRNAGHATNTWRRPVSRRSAWISAQGGDGYPASSQDINLAIRWVKAHAARLGLDAGRVGLCGQSSGGHLAMLAAMRPEDARYAALPLEDGVPAVDASVRCVVMAWPVINPLSRYRHAQRGRAEATPPAWIGDIPERHDLYWKTEAAMAEGNPMLALERGEPVRTPPALWVQGRPDGAHDYRDPESPIEANEPERFVADYRKAGGRSSWWSSRRRTVIPPIPSRRSPPSWKASLARVARAELPVRTGPSTVTASGGIGPITSLKGIYRHEQSRS